MNFLVNIIIHIYNLLIYKLLGNLRRLLIRAPKSCVVYPGVRSIQTKYEGKNFINRKARLMNSYIGYGSYISQNSIINRCKIGKYSVVGFESMVGAHPLHKIVSIHPAFYSTKAQYGFTYAKKTTFQEYHYRDSDEKFFIEIGNDVWIGYGNTKIIQNIKIGDGAVVLANAFVTKDVPPYAIVGGIPAKIIGYRFDDDDIEFLLKLKWWDKNEKWIEEHIDYFSDIKKLKKIVCDEENDI